MSEQVDGVPGVGRVVVIIPTYNESENVRLITARVREAVPQVDVLVADDNSPDGTGRIADELAAADPQIHVLHRAGKEGLGAAYIAGFGWARERGYDAVVQMDADGSHAPEELPKLLHALRDADAVIGSRYVRGGKVVNWPLHREVLSRGGNIYVRTVLGMKIKDATGGYRAYRMAVLDKEELASIQSQGYSYQVELTWRIHRNGFIMTEVPITFAEREHGASKMSGSIVKEALWRVTIWGAKSRANSVRRALKPKSTWP
ncbi:dolichol-phosphate mannosyltransferase [Rhizocola hellebori]|uniref:Dolichol-phosphate mannosyltransferase n=1 Tax=Rhizocola hellebori TaxID=1392758 RepID=A0A8J3QCH3_9ACTN|nr:polyprenol monophosphomannose synthase [Rhizocola hellebori]GIH07324.1 dolichol-phosphate mannosyltransferase [Rhizocola hellebori]